MSDVAHTVHGTVRSAEQLAADTHLRTMFSPIELPPNAAGRATPTESGHRGLDHYADHRGVISAMSEMC